MKASSWTLAHFRDRDLRELEPRDDMAAAWTVRRGLSGRVLAVGGYSRRGAAEASGWMLTADLSAREWACVVRAIRLGLRTVRGWRTVRRLHVLADGRRPGARRLLERLGFEKTGEDDGDAVMTLEIGE
jgi:RimJ/RimL family protein N-acetyltransferase